MRRRSRVSRPVAVASILLSTVLAAGCTQQEAATDQMGNATPAVSPAAVDPDGEIIALPAGQDEVLDLAVAEGDILGLRSAETLAVGTVEQFAAGEQVELGVDKLCGDLTATGGTFVLPCADGVYLIDAAAPDLSEKRETEQPATVAALTTSGELLVGNDTEESLTIHREGQEPVTFEVAAANTQLIAVPVDDRHDAVIRTWNADTTIQDVDYPNDQMGATLRVGLGVAQMAGGEDGLIVVSDNRGGQIAIYNADNIIRLQMTAPVDADPWAVAWSSADELAWITSLSENSLVGYQISEGVPEERARLNTVADAQHLVALSDSTLVVASATGDGLQVIENPTR